jgi:SAM-dependent methyltransferase
MPPHFGKDWERHVAQVEALARTEGFQRLREQILARAAATERDVAIDVGAGSGLLALALARVARKVYALDISSPMCARLHANAQRSGLDNVEVLCASATSVPLDPCSVDVAVSNYTLHHLADADKEAALAEMFRVLRPGGRLVLGDMMFRVSLRDPRDRAIILAKARAMAHRGPAGIARLVKNAARFGVLRRGRLRSAGLPLQPADARWWRSALARAGFVEISVELLEHEGGLASGRRPPRR